MYHSGPRRTVDTVRWADRRRKNKGWRRGRRGGSIGWRMSGRWRGEEKTAM